MWKSRLSDFQGLWEERETVVWFSSLSPPRRSRCAPGPAGVGSGAAFGVASQELAFGALHAQGSFGVGLSPGECVQFGERHARPQDTLAVRRFLQKFEG